MHPLVGFGEELKRLRELTVRVAAEEGELEYLVGTMIELPRACVRADEIAEHADFFSFGTNDLTQTALGLSRDDAGRFLSHYLETGVLERDPFETIDQDGVGDLMGSPSSAAAAPARTSSSASAASTGASRSRSRSATGSGSTTSAARRIAFRSPVSPPRRLR